QAHSVTAGVIRERPRPRIARLGTSLATALKWGSLLPGLDRNVTAIDQVAHSLMSEFDLAAPFVDWFRFHVSSVFARYCKIREVLQRMSPRPTAIVFSTEYQATSRAVLSAAGLLGIRTVLLQHGFLGQAWLHSPIAADKLCVWVEVDGDWYLRRGQP